MKPADFVTILVLALMIIAIMKWPRVWRFVRFPNSSYWPTIAGVVEQVLVHTYSGTVGPPTEQK
jgi:hypothetical protein